MFLPEMTKKKHARVSVTRFAGIDAHLTAPAGQFMQSVNMSSDEYPTLTVRPPRRVVGGWIDGGQQSAVVIENAICYVAGGILYINRRGEDGLWGNIEVLDVLDPDVTEERLLVPYSYYLLIFPDKVYVNTLDVEDRGDMTDETLLFGGHDVYVEVCDRDGKAADIVNDDLPQDMIPDGSGEDTAGWEDTVWLVPSVSGANGTRPRLYRYTKDPDTGKFRWEERDPYIRFGCTDAPLPDWLAAGELVRISVWQGAVPGYFIDPLNDETHYIEAVNEEVVTDGGVKHFKHFKHSVTIAGVLRSSGFTIPANAELTIRRCIPTFDCAVSHNGRVYGARRGRSGVTGEDVNEIYISAADDFRRFFRLEDTTADPITMSVLEPGQFHAASVIDGVVTFFKDHKVLEVGGSTVSGFYLEPREGRRPAFPGTLCIPDGIAYYLATGGEVVARYGGVTTVVSTDLGTRLMGTRRAVAGVSGSKYYLYTEGRGGDHLIHVYDAATKVWQAETVERGVAFFAPTSDGLLLFERADEPGGAGRILSVDRQSEVGEIPAEEADMAWSWETGLLGLDTPRKKYISRVEIRLLMEPGAEVFLSAQYDSREEWDLLWRAESDTLRTVSSRTVPHRCDHVRLKLEGHGRVTLLGVFYEYRESGGSGGTP